MQKYVRSIDIGSENISATLAKVDNDEFSIVHSVSVKSKGITKGKISDINLAAQAIKECSARLNSATNVNLNNFNVGISSFGCRTTIAKGTSYIIGNEGIINSNFMNTAIQDMLDDKNTKLLCDEEILDISIESFIIDDEIVCQNPVNQKGNKLEVIASMIICKKEIIHSYKNTFSLCKIEIDSFYSNLNSLRKILLNKKTEKNNILILDVGAECVDIGFFEANMLSYLSYIGLGGKNITNDLVFCADISNEDAEIIKTKYSGDYRTKFKQEFINKMKNGNSLLDNELYYKVVNARIEEIVKLISEELSKTDIINKIDEIYLIGEGLCNFQDVKYVLEDIFGKKVIIITKNALGLQISSIINSIGIVKDAYDRLKLEEEKNKTENIKKDETKTKKFDSKLNDATIKTNSKKKSWFKRLIDDIF